VNIVSQASTDGDGRSRVSLGELIGLRQRVTRAKPLAMVSRSARSGQQSSRLYGRGMDYAESRVYQAGDDVRRLDWRLTARSGKLHTKLFQEDREGCLLILFDTHASMQFGTRRRFKSVQAARAAAFAAWYAARAGERVGIMAFGRAEQLLRPQAGTRGALAICGALANWDATSPSSQRVEPLGDAVTRAGRLLHGASRVLLVSDGFSCDAPARARLLGLTRHAALGVLVIADVLERGTVRPGRYPVEHAGERSEVLLESERQRSEFQQALGAGPARLSQMAGSLGLRCSEVDTAAEPFEQVASLLGMPRPAR
jgi:uncharacterized protein (DUF58 family)